MDASDREMSTAVLIRSLREMPDPPLDMVAAERSLHQGLRHRAVRRRVASVIAVLALAALVITGLNLWRSPEAPLPARQLQSGLPSGTLLGNLTYHELDGPHPAQLVLVVRSDGTGTYSMRVVRDDERIYDNSSWPVRFVGTSPGRVVVKRAAPMCRTDDNELTLEFAPAANGVRILSGSRGTCSAWPPMSRADLRGVVLRLQHHPS
jgi:hypothetical protein